MAKLLIILVVLFMVLLPVLSKKPVEEAAVNNPLEIKEIKQITSFFKIHDSPDEGYSFFEGIRVDLNNDGNKEIILYSYHGGPFLIVKPNKGSYDKLYINDRGYRVGYVDVDESKNIHVKFLGTGTGIMNEETIILRWDGSNVREVWTADTAGYNYSNFESGKWEDYESEIEIVKEGGSEILTCKTTFKYGIWDTNNNTVEKRRNESRKTYIFDKTKFQFISMENK